MIAKNDWPNIFPSLPDNPYRPEWVGQGFQVGNEFFHVLSYEKSSSGWTDDLTTFHEETAGESHFIDQASRKQAVYQLTKHIKTDKPVIMDIGCSSGFLIKEIKKVLPSSFVIGTDVVMGPLMKLASTNPDTPLLHFDLTRCPLPDNSVDAVVLLNVLEHIENDELAVRQLFRILKPGGIAVIEVPAGPELYDIYDEHLMHYRRYRLSDLRRIFLDQKFSVLHQSHLGFFLYPGFFLVKKLRKGKRADILYEEIPERVSHDIKKSGSNPFFHVLMEFELLAGRLISYPFGIRCLLTAQKTEG
jgi:SAM-dependent methyltransferase